MSKLTELLDELCPDGVEYLPLGEVAEVLRGRRLTKKSLTDDGPYPVFHGGLDPIGYFESCNRPAHTVMVINVGASAGTVGYSAVDFWSSDGCYCLELAEGIDPRYVFQALKNQERHFFHRVRRAGIPTLDADVISRFTIPIPPLEVQQEIVRVLDAFTDLEQSLVSELELRKKQLEATRDSVYSLPSVLTEKFSDLGTIHRGKRFVKKDFREQGVPCIHYGEIYTKYGVSARESYSFVDPSLARGLRKAKPNDVIVASAGETVEDIGNGVAWIGDEEVVIHDACYVLRTELDPLYVSHFLRTNSFHDAIRKSINTSKISSISVKGLGEAHIPIPSLAVQREIVAKLNAFEALIQSLEQEIVLRRKQYDYYRDELLSFNSSTSRGA